MSHAVDLQNDAFTKEAALLYAADLVDSKRYIQQSAHTAMVAEVVSGGLRGKRVVDIGCGPLTTTLALTSHTPSEIVAFDASRDHIDIAEAFIGEYADDLVRESKLATILGHGYSQRLERYFRLRGRELEGSVFRRCGGTIQIQLADLLTVDPTQLGKPADVAVANNVLHWPINKVRGEKRDAISTMNAVSQVLASTARLVRPGGYVVALEPKDFFVWNTPSLERVTAAATLANHPVLLAMNKTFNALLMERHGIERQMPRPNVLFHETELPRQAREAGLGLERIVFVETVSHCDDTVCTFSNGMPMWLGSVALPFEQKLALMNETRAIVDRTVVPIDRELPLRGEYAILVFRRLN